VIEPLIASAGVLGVGLGVGAFLLHDAPSEYVATLGFPADLGAEQVESVLATIAGLPAHARVHAEVDGHHGRLSFRLRAERSALETLRASLRGIAPQLHVGESVDFEHDPPARLTARLGWRGTHVLLRRDQRELSVAALLGVLREAGTSERVRLSVRLRPVVRPKAPRRLDERSRDPEERMRRVLSPTPELPSDQLRQIRQQYAGLLLSARIELLVWASSDARARQLLTQVVAVLRGRSGARGRFSVRTHSFALPSIGTMLPPAELVAVIGWPLDGVVVPGLSYNRAPRLLPDPRIPTRGARCFGMATWPGMEERPLWQPSEGALSHALLVGPTGSGKSALLARLFLDCVAAGRGALAVDMKGDTADDLLARLPKKRHGDVVIFDPADARPLPALKAVASSSPELTADLWIGLFRAAFADAWTLRTERYLRLAVRTIAHDEAVSIVDLPRVFSDLPLRRRLLARANDPLLASAWATFDALSPAQRAEHLAAPLGKAQDLFSHSVIRRVLGQQQPKMTIARAIRAGRIVVVRLPAGELGSMTAQLLGGLVVHEIFQAVMARQALAASRRRPYGVYVDEPAVMRLVPVPLDSLYELARGLGVGMTIATQSVSQLPDVVRRAVLANAATIATFRAEDEDARLMARKLPGITSEQVQHLERFEIALRLGLAHGEVANVTTARTLPLPDPTVDVAALRDLSAKRFGATVETPSAPAEVTEPPDIDDVPIGRRRRS
jgi:hypothetical protein